ncbi:MAG TPA: MATE family efflux transporter [Candidatus Caccousia avicola]|uniref:Probable multidrug resistance protein NorM n=1 Tax=Candidatus Caccousia avicola TaxID=2840721 RepID=A0A9D1ANR0_9FIRM|nr:MATE family efflux transporter [Candidatus Caccousia avicola]
MVSFSALLQEGRTPTRREEISAVLALSWPAIVQQLMLTLVQYIDTVMVGSLGPNATASVGVVSSSVWLFNGLLGAAAIGFAVQVAQHIGAGETEQARGVVRESLLFNVLFGLFMGALAVGLSFPLPGLLGAEKAIQSDASWYFRIVGCSMPFLMAINLLSSLLRCMGDTRTPMLYNITLNILNTIFNFVLIYPSREAHLFGMTLWLPGAGLGVPGAALGSAFASLLVALLFLRRFFRRGFPLQIHLRDKFRFTKSCLSAMVRIAIPQAMAHTASCGAQIAVTVIVAGLGTQAVAANSLAVTAEALCYQPGYGVSTAATTLVGQAIGAGRRDMAVRFARVSTWLGMAIMTGTGLLMFLFAEPLIGMFTPDVDVMRLGASVLRIEAFAEPLFAASIVASGAFSGAGDTKWSFAANLLSMWGVRLPIALLLIGSLGLTGMWIAMCCELSLKGLVFLWRLRSNRWLDSGTVVVGRERA